MITHDQSYKVSLIDTIRNIKQLCLALYNQLAMFASHDFDHVVHFLFEM